MEGSGAPIGVDDGVPVAVDGFFGKVRSIPKSHSLVGTPVQTYYTGTDMFSVHIGDYGAEFVIWTDVRGVEALIGSLQAALVRARIARDAAGLGPLGRFSIPGPLELDPTDVPF